MILNNNKIITSEENATEIELEEIGNIYWLVDTRTLNGMEEKNPRETITTAKLVNGR